MKNRQFGWQSLVTEGILLRWAKVGVKVFNFNFFFDNFSVQLKKTSLNQIPIYMDKSDPMMLLEKHAWMRSVFYL